MSPEIFEGVKVLDFTQVIAGSYATTVIGDMGAEIIKVEPPGIGDTLRLAGPMYEGESGFFLLNNRNKKSISINLKSPEGVQIVQDLIAHCDVIVQNFKPGVMDKLGLGYEQAVKVKKDIIYVCVSGYGYNNRYSSRPAYDNIIQSEAGLAAQNGLAESGRPLRSPLSISDYAAGMYGAFAIASALYYRKNSGEGQFVDIAMLDSLVSMMDNSFLTYDLLGGEIKKNGHNEDKKTELLQKMGLRSSGNRHPGAAPHSYYRTKDGYIAHMSLTNEMWHKLLKIIGKEDLIGDAKYEKLDNRKMLWKEIDEMVEEWSRTKTTEEALKSLEEKRLPCGKVRTIDEVCEDPHSMERGIFGEVEHKKAGKMRITNIPVKFSKTPTRIKTGSPQLGEHNVQVLGALLGYSKEQVNELQENKILFSK